MPATAPNHADAESVSPQSGRQLTMSGAYGTYRNNKGLGSALVTLLVIDSMLALFVLISTQVIDPAILHGPANHVSEILHATSLARIMNHMLAMLAFFIWINRSCKNAWLLDPPKMQTTPAWAVGYYFIPILSLWKPYVSMLEIRNASYGQHDRLGKLLPLWWIGWITCLTLAMSHFGTSHLPHDAPAQEDALSMTRKIGTIGATANMVFNYLTIMVVVAITGAQNRRLIRW